MVMGEKKDGVGFRISSKRLPRDWTQRANRLLDQLFGFESFNAAFRAAPECPDSELAQAILDALGVRLELSGASKDLIPSKGALVVVCNHPFGVVDGLAIGAVVQSIRSDVSMVVAHWFAQVARLRNPFLIVVGARAPRNGDVKASRVGSRRSSGSNAAAQSSSSRQGRRRASAGGDCQSLICRGARMWRASFEKPRLASSRCSSRAATAGSITP